MKNKILGSIGILWGGSIVVRWLLSGSGSSGNAAYDAGHTSAVVFGAVMLVVGLYYVFKKQS